MFWNFCVIWIIWICLNQIDRICNLLLSLLRSSIIQFLHFLAIFLCMYSCSYPNLGWRFFLFPAVVQHWSKTRLFQSVYKYLLNFILCLVGINIFIVWNWNNATYAAVCRWIWRGSKLMPNVISVVDSGLALLQKIRCA